MSIASRLNTVMELVASIEKDGTMAGVAGGYKYLSEEKIVSVMHSAFTKAGLVIYPIAMDILDNRTVVVGQQGKEHMITRIMVSYQLAEVEGGDTAIITALGEGQDGGDKCLNKAMTGAYKYALRQTCMISSGDDPDHESSKEGTIIPQKTQPSPNKLLNQAASLCAEVFGRDANGRASYHRFVMDTVGKTLDKMTPEDHHVLLAAATKLVTSHKRESADATQSNSKA